MMKVKNILILIAFSGVLSISSTDSIKEFSHEEPQVKVRLAAYNVLFGNWGVPQRIGEMLKPYNFDIIGFSEVPDGNWTAQVGELLGMKYSYVGSISSANHEDKFKSILSRTPLSNMHEIEINADGWTPASMVGAEMEILYVQIDSDGYSVPIIELYQKKIGLNVMSPFEVASGCDVVEIGKQFPDLVMIGGIDKRVLAQDKMAIDKHLEYILRALRKRGGYIPTCDHGVPAEVNLENYLYYRKRCVELGS